MKWWTFLFKMYDIILSLSFEKYNLVNLCIQMYDEKNLF